VFDDKGNLAYEYKTPNRQFAKDVEDMIRSGDVDQSSFAFTVKEDKWQWSKDETKKDRRTIMKFEKLYDVSPVTYAANPKTNVQLKSASRTYEAAKAEHEAAIAEENKRQEEIEKQKQILNLKLKMKGI